MPRLARIVIPGLPHHVTQRGNRREAIFFQDGDQDIYRDLPTEPASLGRAVGEAHRRYTNYINGG